MIVLQTTITFDELMLFKKTFLDLTILLGYLHLVETN